MTKEKIKQAVYKAQESLNVDELFEVIQRVKQIQDDEFQLYVCQLNRDQLFDYVWERLQGVLDHKPEHFKTIHSGGIMVGYVWVDQVKEYDIFVYLTLHELYIPEEDVTQQ